MLRNVIKALHQYHGIDPSTYVLGTKDTTEVNGSGSEQNTEVSNGSEQNTEVSNGSEQNTEVSNGSEQNTDVDNGSEDITNRGQYTTDEVLDGVPRTPGNYTDDEQPPEKKEETDYHTLHSTSSKSQKEKERERCYTHHHYELTSITMNLLHTLLLLYHLLPSLYFSFTYVCNVYSLKFVDLKPLDQ